MPIMDGLECMRRIREMERDGKLLGHVPIIALTANAAGTFLNKLSGPEF
jgi:CheY-like chemotaxis protein